MQGKRPCRGSDFSRILEKQMSKGSASLARRLHWLECQSLKRWRVRFLIRAHPQGAGSIPSRSMSGRQPIDLSLTSLFLFLSLLSLKINKHPWVRIKKKKGKNKRQGQLHGTGVLRARFCGQVGCECCVAQRGGVIGRGQGSIAAGGP